MTVIGQHHAPAALPPGKGPRCPLNRTSGGLQSRPEGCPYKLLFQTKTGTLIFVNIGPKPWFWRCSLRGLGGWTTENWSKILIIFFFPPQSYRASWYDQSLLFYQLRHKRIALKLSIKIYIKTTQTCFGVITIIRSARYELAKITIVKIVNLNTSVWLTLWYGAATLQG